MINLNDYYDTETYVFRNEESRKELESAFRNESLNILSYLEKLTKTRIDSSILDGYRFVFSNDEVIRRYEVNTFDVNRQLDELIRNPYLTYKDKLAELKEALNSKNDEVLKEKTETVNELVYGRKDYVSIKVNNILKVINSYLMSLVSVNGSFSYEEKIITLYLKSICRSKEAEKGGINDALMTVYSHELFHAYHYNEISKSRQKWGSKDFGFYITVESLAKCFEMLYCENILKNSSLYELTDSSLKKCDINSWPYAGAVYIKEKFFEVLKISLYNWKKAYKEIEGERK